MFIRCQNPHTLQDEGESVTADHKAATNFPAEFKTFNDEMGYHPKQIFNADESGLF